MCAEIYYTSEFKMTLKYGLMNILQNWGKRLLYIKEDIGYH